MRTKLARLSLLALPCISLAYSPILEICESRDDDNEKVWPTCVRAQRERHQVEMLEKPCGPATFKTDLSFLIWQAQEDGLEFAASNSPKFPLTANIPTDISAKFSTVDFAWAPAFKLLLGYSFEKPSWDFNARWTWYHSHSDKSLSSDLTSAGGGLFPLWIPPQAAIASFPMYSHAKGTFLLLMNNIDFELAYTGGISKTFFLNFSGGLKAVSIHQTFRTKYSGGFLSGVNQMLESNATAKGSCLGLGPRISAGSKWMLPKGWSLIAEAAAALALSTLETKRKDFSIGTISGAPQEIATRLKESFWVWRPLVEGKTGVRWVYCYGQCNSKTLDFELAYEIQQYWDQNMLNRYADSAVFYMPYNNRGNLTFQGFSLTLALGY